MIRRTNIKMASRYDFLLSFILTLIIVIIETIIIALNIGIILVNSFQDLLYSPIKICVYIAYVLSVFFIPMISMRFVDFVNDIRNIYKFYVIKSLALESIDFIDKLSKILPISLPLAFLFIIMSVVFKVYILSLIALIPLGLYLILLIKPFYNVYNHSKRIDIELPWFLVLLIILESINANIKLLIEKLRYTNILPSITKELLVIDRDSKLYSQSYVSAFIDRARITPNAKLSDVLSGYASRLRSGGEVTSWLLSKLNELLIITEFSIRLYSERIVAVFGQIMLALYVVTPLITIAVYTINIYIVLSLMILATPLLITLIYTSQPKMLNSLPISRLILLPLSILVAVSVTLYRFVGPHSIAFGWVVALSFVYIYSDAIKEMNTLEKDSIEMIKIMVELRQSGLDVVKALEFISSSNIISKTTTKKLRIALTMLYQGIPLTYVAVKIPSYSFLFKFTLFTFGIIYECGGGSPEVFQTLYEYVTKIKALHSNIEKTSRFFDIFAFVNTFILAWIWKSLTPIYSSFNMINPILNASLSSSTIYTIAYISSLGYSFASSTVRNGLPILEVRSIIFLLVIAITILIISL